MLVYLIAGEPSGDALGARLMQALRQRCGDHVCFAGIGGEAMTGEGLDSLFPMEDLSVMGLAEVLPSLPRILKRLRQTKDDLLRRRPDAVVTIDSWGFSGRIQKFCQRNLPQTVRIHYVAPMVWAWRPGRAKTLARVLDVLMTLLPFEPEWFLREGLHSVHVGHAVLESGAERGDGAAFRSRHGLANDAPVLLALLGSRKQEIGRLAPVYQQTCDLLARRYPNLVAVVPTVAAQAERVRAIVREWPVRCVVVDHLSERYDAFASADVALAASGTVTLELALARIPMVVVYKVSALSYQIGTRILGLTKRLRWVTLINILLGRMAVPEFLQDRCRADFLAEAVETLLSHAQSAAVMRADLDEAIRLLREEGGISPSLKAADAVVQAVRDRREQEINHEHGHTH